MEAFLGDTLNLTRHEHTYDNHQPEPEPVPVPAPKPPSPKEADLDDGDCECEPLRPAGWGWLLCAVLVAAVALWARPSGPHLLPALGRYGELNRWQSVATKISHKIATHEHVAMLTTGFRTSAADARAWLASAASAGPTSEAIDAFVCHWTQAHERAAPARAAAIARATDATARAGAVGPRLGPAGERAVVSELEPRAREGGPLPAPAPVPAAGGALDCALERLAGLVPLDMVHPGVLSRVGSAAASLLLQSQTAVTSWCQQGRAAMQGRWPAGLSTQTFSFTVVLDQFVVWARRLWTRPWGSAPAGYCWFVRWASYGPEALAAGVTDLDHDLAIHVWSWSSLALVGYVMACFTRRVFRHWLGEGPPDIVYNRRSTRLNRLLVRLPTLRKGYAPPPLLPTGVLQSSMAEAYQPSPEDTPFVREVLHLDALDFASTPGRRKLKRKCCPDWVPEGVAALDWLGHTPSPAELREIQSHAADADPATAPDAGAGATARPGGAGLDTSAAHWRLLQAEFELFDRRLEREPAPQGDPELMAMLDDSLADFNTTASTSAASTTRLREARRQTLGGGEDRPGSADPSASGIGDPGRQRPSTAPTSSGGTRRHQPHAALPPVPQCWPWWSSRAKTVAVLVPGLCGDSTAGYIRRTALALRRAGVVVAVYNPRGRGGNVLKTPFLYSAGYTEDLRRALDRVHRRFPTSPVCLMGFSLGANVVAKFVGEEGIDCRLAGAIALAAPVDCVSMSNWLLGGFLGKLMDPVLVGAVQRVRAQIEPVLQRHRGIDIAKVKAARTMADFDDAAIAPMMGCRTASAYYREASSGNTLGDVAVPMLFLNAMNDPIVPGGLVRRDDFAGGGARPRPDAPPGSLILALTKEGGHSMVYPEGWLAQGAWTGKVVTEFVLAVAKGL